MLDWLVDEAGCELLREWEGGWGGIYNAVMYLSCLQRSAEGSGSSPEKLDWLDARGATMEDAVARWARLPATLYWSPTEDSLCMAVRYRCAPLVAWLLQHGCRVGASAYARVAGHGDPDMLQWLVQHAPCPEGAGSSEASSERLADTVAERWPQERDRNGRGGPASLQRALQLLREAGCERPTNHRALELLEQQQGMEGEEQQDQEAQGAAFVPATIEDLDEAAEAGDLPRMRTLRTSRHVPVDGPAPYVAAVRGGCAVAVEWAWKAGGRPQEGRQEEPYWEAAVRGDLLTLECLKRLGAPLDRADFRRGFLPPLRAIRWLMEVGGTGWEQWDLERVAGAVQRVRGAGGGGRGREESAEWLAERVEQLPQELQGQGQGQGQQGLQGQGEGQGQV